MLEFSQPSSNFCLLYTPTPIAQSTLVCTVGWTDSQYTHIWVTLRQPSFGPPACSRDERESYARDISLLYNAGDREGRGACEPGGAGGGPGGAQVLNGYVSVHPSSEP